MNEPMSRNPIADFLIKVFQSRPCLHKGMDGPGVACLTEEQIAARFQLPVHIIQETLSELYGQGAIERNAACPDGSHAVEAVIAVGMRVESAAAISFRRWLTVAIRDFSLRGYLIDQGRLAGTGMSAPSYFDGVLEAVQDLRTSHRVFHQKVTDLFALAADYHRDAATTQAFYGALLPHALRWTAAGPTPGSPEDEFLAPTLADYLDFAVGQANDHIPLYMNDWAEVFEVLLDVLKRGPMANPEGSRALIVGSLEALKSRIAKREALFGSW